jgi:DNA polymerase-3 subunit alpha
MINIYSQYTKPEGSIKFQELIDASKKRNIKTLALTDHGNFSGIIEFYNLALVNGIKPIIGLDLFYKLKNGNFVRFVFYMKNSFGYTEILKLIPKIKIFNDDCSYIMEEDMDGISLENIYLVIGAYKIDYLSLITPLEDDFSIVYDELFYLFFSKESGNDTKNIFFQLIYDENEENRIVIESILNLKNLYPDLVNLIASNPVYYLDKNDHGMKNLMLNLYNKSFEGNCTDLKDEEKEVKRDSLTKSEGIFDFEHSSKISSGHQYLNGFEDFSDNFPEDSIENRNLLIENCNMFIDKLPVRYPEFALNREIEFSEFDTIKNLIHHRFEKYHSEDDEKEREKLKEILNFEINYIRDRNLSRYLLLLFDMKNEFSGIYDTTLYFSGSLNYLFSAFLLNLTISRPDSFKRWGYFKSVLEREKFYPVISANISSLKKDDFLGFIRNRFGKEF